MAETKKPAATKHISDVNRPNTSAPSATSKAVIVNNRPLLQDPMVVGETKSADDAGTKIIVTTGSKAKIQPLTAPVVEATKAKPASESTTGAVPAPKDAKAEVTVSDSIATTETSAETAPASEKTETATDEVTTAAPEPAKSADPAEAVTETSTDETTETDEAENGEATQTETSPEADQAAAEAEAAKHDEAMQQMVESKQYFLPINSLEKRRTKRVVVLGIALSVLLAVAWVDVALDASLIQLGSVKPVTHFFSN
jgi:cobalamin biosynthesis protein CobT